MQLYTCNKTANRTPNPICPNRRKNRSPQNPIPTELAGVGEIVWLTQSKGIQRRINTKQKSCLMLSVFFHQQIEGLSVIRPTAAQKRLRGGDALCRCWCFFTNNFPERAVGCSLCRCWCFFTNNFPKRAVGPPLFVVFRRMTANAL